MPFHADPCRMPASETPSRLATQGLTGLVEDRGLRLPALLDEEMLQKRVEVFTGERRDVDSSVEKNRLDLLFQRQSAV